MPVLMVVALQGFAADYYISPSGSSSGAGTISSPWSIATGLRSSSVRPGDTVWLRGGTYLNGGGNTVTSTLSGTSSVPVYIRQYPGERATINGGLGIAGNYAWYWGFEVTNNNWSFPRSTGEPGSFPSGKPSDAVYLIQGSTGNKIINMVIHDGADGIADQQEGVATESYGNIIYNNGWIAPDRGHGHSIYLQNASTIPKIIKHNITFNSFDIGVQAYGSAGPVAYLTLDGNITFNEGLPAGHRVANILVQGGGGIQQAIKIYNSVFYNPLDAASSNTGYNQLLGTGVDLTVQNNWWVGATPTGYWTLAMSNYQSLLFTGNKVVGPVSISNIPSNNWSGNTYYKSSPPGGLDSGSPINGSNPTGVTTIVQPNQYEPGRANITVMNWAKNPTVTVDISQSGLQPGTAFEVRDVQNFWGPAILTGTYDGSGSIILPTTLTQVSAISGGYPTPPHTSSEFNVFVLLPQGTIAAPPPLAPAPLIALNNYSLSFSGVATTSIPSQTVNLTNGGSSNTTLNWTASSNQGWLSVSPGSGQYANGTGGALTVSVNTAGLAPGQYQGIITVTDPAALNNPQTINVTMNLTLPPPPSGTGLLTSFALGRIRNDFTGLVGMQINVGSSTMTVSHLGRLNGPGNNQTHLVKLVTASTGADVTGASVSIPAGSTSGVFAYGALATPVVLAANTSYFLVSQETSGGDKWYDLDTTMTTTSAASITTAVYRDTAYRTLSSSGHGYGPLTLGYVLGGTVSNPPPTNPPPTNPPPTNPPPTNPPPTTGGTAFVTGQVLGRVRSDFSGFVGMYFKVGSSALTVTGVGRYVNSGNSGTHTVKIVNATTGADVSGASAAVATSGVTAGSYAYAAVNNVVLNANTGYFLLTQETANADTWYDFNTTVQTTNAGTSMAAVYAIGSTYYTLGSSGMAYGPANFQYTTTAPTVITVPAAASFVKVDTSTMGSWANVYGQDGQAIAGDLIRYPLYSQVAMTGAASYTWAQTTTEVRGLQKASNPSERLAATFYGVSGFAIDTNLTDGATHRVALYCLDWDNAPRRQRIDVIDADTQTVLDSRTVDNFRNGVYMVWNVRGHVNFKVTNLSGPNAAISGVLFGGQ